MFIKILLVSLFVVYFLYDQVIGHECGIVYNQEKAKNNIINEKLLEGDWPWVVAIFHNGEKICTGSIISPKFVLTAAHCINERMLNKKKKKHSFSIHAGTIYSNEGEVVRVTKIKTYDEVYSVARNDIAMLELADPLIFNHNVSSICLPKNFHEFPGNLAFVAGFGNILSEGSYYQEEYNNLLHHAIIPFQEFDYCDQANKKWNYTSSNYICAGGRMKAFTEGDSGGPLMIKKRVLQQGSYKSRWIAVGVVVGGNYINEKEREQSVWPQSFFTRISSYCDWIEDITGGNAKCMEVLRHPLTVKPRIPTCCPSGWIRFNETNSCYLVQYNANWSDAEKICVSKNAHLVSIHSDDEENFVLNLTRTGQPSSNAGSGVWIGLKAIVTGKSYGWTDGSPVDYTKWAVFPGGTEPDSYGQFGFPANCVDIHPDTLIGNEGLTNAWDDDNCWAVMRAFVCKQSVKNC